MSDEAIPKSVPEVFAELFGFEAKTKQLEAIIPLMQDRASYVFVALPTGYGKSMCYMAPPVILDKMDPLVNGKRHVALVVSPLRSLMADQVKRCEELGVKAIWFHPESTEEEIKGFRNADYSVVFTSPECAITDDFKKTLLSKKYKEQLCLLAFDEAHCISQWGLDFRPAYRKVHILVSLVTVPLLCLTATVTKAILEDINEVLAMGEDDTTMVASLPDRPNIYLRTVSKPGMQIHDEIGWYIQLLKEKREIAPKAIIFGRTLGDIIKLFETVCSGLEGNIFATAERSQATRLVDMYFADSGHANQQHVLQTFPQLGGYLRCLVCSNAFGMGVEIPDVKFVFHWGAPISILSYWQEVGRCARSVDSGEAHLLAHKGSLVQRKEMGPTEEMVALCTSSDNCIRELIMNDLHVKGMDPFLPPKPCNTDSHGFVCVCAACVCCSVCREKCACRTTK